MTVAIKNGRGEFLCTTNTALPRWGRLEAMSALLTFASSDDAEDFMDRCQTIEFGDDCRPAAITFT